MALEPGLKSPALWQTIPLSYCAWEKMTPSCTAYGGREGHTRGHRVCGPDSVGRYSELIEMVPALYLYSILRRAFFLRDCQFSGRRKCDGVCW